ncbi:MAG: YfhO family protein [Saprospiraceae bacterium]
MKQYFGKLIPYLLGLFILISISTIFLAPQLTGKVLQGESVQNAGVMKEAQDYHKKYGSFSYWTNSIFGGMPTYLIYGGPKAGIVDYIASSLKLFRNDSLGYFILIAIAAYLGFIFFSLNPWLCLLGAITVAFASTHIGVLVAGHNSKLASASFSVLMVAGVFRLFQKEWLMGGFAFVLGLSLSIVLGHPQMTYYSLLGCGVFFLFKSFESFKNKEFKTLGIITSIMIACTLAALSTSLYQSLVIRKFSDDTMRGGSILSVNSNLVKDQGVSKSTESGLGYEYAMGWSDGVHDLLAFIIPGAVGGSNAEKVKNNNKINALLKSNGIQPQETLPLYWGDLAFTASPDYVGSIIILLFVLGLFYIKGPLKWGLFSAISLLLFMSLGKNFNLLNKFLFDYLPMLNKFRTPNSIHNVSVCLIAVFSVLGLHHFLNTDDKKLATSNLLKVGGGIILFILLFGLGGGMFFDFTSNGDSRYDPKVAQLIKEARIIYLNQDSFRSLLFVMSGIGILFAFCKSWISKNITIGLLCLVTFIDLFGVAKRYIGPEDWKKSSVVKNEHILRACDKQILADNALHYRVFDLSKGDPFQNASSAYFHKLIGGYSPAKFRRYQDIIDAYISKGDEKMLNMLNTKYVISQNEQVVERPSTFGNAWLINNIKSVMTPDEEILGVSNIDPLQTALILEREFPGYISSNANFDKIGTILLTKYEPNELTYTFSSKNEQFAVFSEVWYGGKDGWQAYIDGKPVEHVRVDYILRGLKIPAGSHQIEFKFRPKSILTIINLNFWINNLLGIVIIGMLINLLYLDYKKNRSEQILLSKGSAAKSIIKRNIRK